MSDQDEVTGQNNQPRRNILESSHPSSETPRESAACGSSQSASPDPKAGVWQVPTEDINTFSHSQPGAS